MTIAGHANVLGYPYRLYVTSLESLNRGKP